MENKYEGITVGITIPTKGVMCTKTVESLLGLLAHNQMIGLSTAIIFAEGTLLTTVRSRLISEAMKKNYSHIMMIDSDMTFSSDLIQKLIDTKKSVVCGIAKVRGGANWNIFKRHEVSGKYVPYTEAGDDLLEIDATGCSCILLEREVISEILDLKVKASVDWTKIEESYPTDNMIVSETLKNLQMDRMMFSAIGEKSEDILMCEYIKLCGYSIWADCSIKLGHINDIEIK